MSKQGGKRPGAGRPIGRRTIEQKVVLEHIKRRVLKNAQKLISAQMGLAMGITQLIKIDKFKKVEVVKDEEIIINYFEGKLDRDPNEYYYLTSEKPDLKAIDSLFNRVLGKPRESLDVTTDGESFNKMNYERAKSIIVGR